MKLKIFSLLLVAAGMFAANAPAQTAVAVATPAPTAPGRIIYSPRLPTAIELTNVAAAQGLSVERIDQTAAQVTATYKAADGSLSMVAYQLVPSVATPAPATTTLVTAVPARTVVYEQPDPFFYYDDPYLSPWGYGYYSPVRVNVGFGFGYGYRGHGGYHGGFHGHGRGR